MPRRIILMTLLTLLMSSTIYGSAIANSISTNSTSHWLQGDNVTVVGIVDRDTLALYHVDSARLCNVAVDDRVMAIARADSGAYYRVYTSSPSCEGVVWISSDAAISWESDSDLDRLPMLVVPETPTYLEELPEYRAICEAAASEDAEQSDATPDSLETLFLPGGWSFVPAEYVAESEDELDVVVCLTPIETEIEVCSVIEGEETVDVPRLQDDLVTTLVEFESEAIITTRRFEGGTPPSCPLEGTNLVEIHGSPPERRVWGAWVVGEMLGSEADIPSFRSYSVAQTLNARSEPTTNSTVLGRLGQETPINPIGRNEAGDWIVAILPDMSKAWLFVDLLNVAVQIDFDGLPVYDVPAEEVPIPVR